MDSDDDSNYINYGRARNSDESNNSIFTDSSIIVKVVDEESNPFESS